MTFRNTFIYLFFFLFFFISSVSVNAYTEFNTNPYFTSDNTGYYIADQFANQSCFLWWCSNNSYSCFDIENTNNKLVLSNSSRCNFSLNYNFAGVSVKMLSDDSYYKMEDGDYQKMVSMSNSKWCDQLDTSPFGVGNQSLTPPYCLTYDYIVLPKNKEGIVLLNYTLTNNGYLDGSYTLLEVWENGVTQINKTLIWYGGNQKATLYIPPKVYDRNLTIFATWKWYTNVPIPIPVTNITIDEFKFLTFDLNEIRTDYTGNMTYEFENYCGLNATVRPPEFLFYYFNTTTGYAMGVNEDNIDCGFVKLGDMIMARRFIWDYYDDGGCRPFALHYAKNLLLVTDVHTNFTAFFETFLRTQIKFTQMNYDYDLSGYGGGYVNLSELLVYNDIFNTTINATSLVLNYPYAYRETVNLTNNPNINISNQNPSGNSFRYRTMFCGVSDERTSSYHQFFSSNSQVENTGWVCSPITNNEQYILPNGSIINEKYCGDFGCNNELTHCNFHFVGTYCTDNYNWAFTDEFGIINTGSCLPYTCTNLTSTTISCVDISGNAIKCINEFGEESDCSGITNNETQTKITNCLNNNDFYCYTALSTFSFIGVTDQSFAESFLSIIITLTIASIVLFTGRKSKFGLEGFLVTVFMFLTGFTLIGKFNPIIWILLIIADGFFLYGMIKGGVR